VQRVTLHQNHSDRSDAWAKPDVPFRSAAREIPLQQEGILAIMNACMPSVQAPHVHTARAHMRLPPTANQPSESMAKQHPVTELNSQLNASLNSHVRQSFYNRAVCVSSFNSARGGIH
jgi:hypothetical protein